jgi:hypothetical protein
MAPPHEVARYWTSGEGIERQRQVGGDAISFVVDLGEASCFACGWWKEPPFDAESIRDAWDSRKTGLERCHLVPHSKGGSDGPENLVLLCPTCHRDAPNCLDPDIMLAWCVRRRPGHFLAEKLKLVVEAVEGAGLDVDDESWHDLVPAVMRQRRREEISFGSFSALAASLIGTIAKAHRERQADATTQRATPG